MRHFLLTAFLAAPALADPLPVHVVTATLAVPAAEAVLTGTLQPLAEAPVAFPEGGRVISVAVRAGDHVTAGQELARLDPTQADAALRAAQASLDGADAALREAEQASDRAQELLDRGAGTRADLDSATKALLAAQSARDQAEAQARKARTARDNTVLTAPRAGTVTDRAVEPGQVVNPGQKVVLLAAEGGMEGVFNAPDGVDLDAFLGDAVTLTPVDQPGLTLAGKITEVSPLVDARTGAVVLKARLDGAPPPGLAFGAAVIGRLALPQLPAITLPWTALTAAGGQPAVWTVGADGVVAQVPVTVAAYGTDSVRLSGGISPGTVVVTDGAQLLYPGRIVVPVEDDR